jgi:hypothetical protein
MTVPVRIAQARTEFLHTRLGLFYSLKRRRGTRGADEKRDKCGLEVATKADTWSEISFGAVFLLFVESQCLAVLDILELGVCVELYAGLQYSLHLKSVTYYFISYLVL